MKGVHHPYQGCERGNHAGFFLLIREGRGSEGHASQAKEKKTVDDVDQDVDETVSDHVGAV
jgi:hypothetical protein